MHDPAATPENDPGAGHEPATTPRWVKVFGIIVGALILLVIVALIGGHGPGRHLHGSDAPASSATTTSDRHP